MVYMTTIVSLYFTSFDHGSTGSVPLGSLEATFTTAMSALPLFLFFIISLSVSDEWNFYSPCANFLFLGLLPNCSKHEDHKHFFLLKEQYGLHATQFR